MTELFNNPGVTTDPNGTLFDTNTPANLDNSKNFLEELVGEGKKFKTVDDLARGKAEADSFIQRLQGELEALRKENASKAALDDVLKALKERTPSNDGVPPRNEQVQQNTLTQEEIDALLDKKLQSLQSQSQAKTNLELVKSELTKIYGEGYGRILLQKCNELDISKEKAEELAKTTPKVFLSLFGSGNRPQEGYAAPPRGNAAVPQGNPSNPAGVRGKSYYDNLKKTDSKTYWSPKVQNQLHQDAMKLGIDKFNEI